MGGLNFKNIAHENKKAKALRDLKSASDMKDRRESIEDLLHEEITKEIQENHAELIGEIIRGKKNKEVLEKIIEDVIDKNDMIKGFSKGELIKELIDQILGWGKLQRLVDESSKDNISNIFTNMDLQVIKRVAGQDIMTNISFESDEELERYIRNIMIRTGEKINRDKCIADAYDNLYNIRINAGIYGSPTRKEVVKRPYLALRLFPAMNFSAQDFVNNDTFSEEILTFLKKYGSDYTFAIVGMPDAGKSTAIDFILSLDHEMKRTVVIEEEAELKYRNKNSVFFEERKGGREDVRHKYDMAEFTKIATRLAGHKVVIGEVRSKEAWFLKRLIDMGYKAIFSVHGSKCKDALKQTAWLMSLANPQMTIETMIKELTESIDFIVYLERRKFVDIAEVVGYDDNKKEPILNYIFQLELDEEGRLYWKEGTLSEEFIKRDKLKKVLSERAV